jgi:hypothetical protein
LSGALTNNNDGFMPIRENAGTEYDARRRIPACQAPGQAPGKTDYGTIVHEWLNHGKRFFYNLHGG